MIRNICCTVLWIAAVAVGFNFSWADAPGNQQLLLSALTSGTSVQSGAWMIDGPDVEPANPQIVPKFGNSALTFKGNAEIAGAKGDFGVAGAVPGICSSLSLWIFISPDSNASRVGVQFANTDDEYLMTTVPVDWTGWKLVDFPLNQTTVQQAFPQPSKNSRLDQPLQWVHIVWFARTSGSTSITVNELTASTQLSENPANPLQTQWMGSSSGDPHTPYKGGLVLTNFSSHSVFADIHESVQHDPTLYSVDAPDPVYGADQALGALSWTVEDGKLLERGSLTDGLDWTSASDTWGIHKEVYQYIDLGRVINTRWIRFLSGDANWIWNVDISSSLDGTEYRPVAGLQNLDWHQKWGVNDVAVPTPFAARFLRLRYYKSNDTVNVFRMPARLMVYSGPDKNAATLPSTGTTIAERTTHSLIPPRSFAAIYLSSIAPLEPGCYLVALKLSVAGVPQLIYTHYFVKPYPLPSRSQKAAALSRFGVNSADVNYAALHRLLGVGWVRFENLKWQMVSPAPSKYFFDGSVSPWHVQVDNIVHGYANAGLNILPFLFQTPDYATSAASMVDRNRWNSYPPKDNAQYADFVYQTVARYGSKTHSADDLETTDKRSGADLIHVYELWNEPSLSDPGWGSWVGSYSQYFDLFRAGSQAVKKADPTAEVTNGGSAGIDYSTIDPLESYHYADGKRPLDFIDILNVHYYTGQTAPEISSVNTNVDRNELVKSDDTYPGDLSRLVSWRDKYKPDMRIWLTETGYDSAGPSGTNERLQAAWLPRDLMIALAAGIDKVFVYRESGSSPSLFAASGLVRDDGSLKPSWFTYATLIRQLSGVADGERLDWPDGNVRLFAWKRGSETVISAWAITDTSKISLSLRHCTVTDSFGASQQVDISENLPLSIFPIYISNIENKKLVDSLLANSRLEEVKRAGEINRLEKSKAYLFQFGSSEKIGTVEIGDVRPFTPVLAKDTFDSKLGYGFSPHAASQDDTRRWIDDPLEYGDCRLDGSVAFELNVLPGKYTLSINAYSLPPAGHVIVKGVVGSPLSLNITSDDTTNTQNVEIGNAPIFVSTDTYAGLHWISLIAR